MRIFSFTLSCSVLALWSSISISAPVGDGNLLLKACKHGNTVVDNTLPNLNQQELYEAGYCHGLMRGVLSELTNNYMGKVCIPVEVNNFQAARIVVKYLGANPELLHRSDYGLSVEALTMAYPCGK